MGIREMSDIDYKSNYENLARIEKAYRQTIANQSEEIKTLRSLLELERRQKEYYRDLVTSRNEAEA